MCFQCMAQFHSLFSFTPKIVNYRTPHCNKYKYSNENKSALARATTCFPHVGTASSFSSIANPPELVAYKWRSESRTDFIDSEIQPSQMEETVDAAAKLRADFLRVLRTRRSGEGDSDPEIPFDSFFSFPFSCLVSGTRSRILSKNIDYFIFIS